MADEKISLLPTAGALTGTEMVPIVQDGVTVKVRAENISLLNIQSLQSVTDVDATTTNSMIVGDVVNEFSQISSNAIGTENNALGTYAYLDSNGTLGLKNGSVESDLKNTNATNDGIILEFPNKPTGSYTIATTEDVPATPILSDVLAMGNSTGGYSIVSPSGTNSASIIDASVSLDFNDGVNEGMIQSKSSKTTVRHTVENVFDAPLHSFNNSVTKGGVEVATINDIPTKTSDLTNDGDDGISHFISLNDLPSNLTLYATNAASDISTYYKLVTAITDPSYNTTAVNIPTGTITTTNQLIASLATSTNVIVGNPGIFNITTIGNIQKLTGTGNAEFYFEVWKRIAAGTETLITTSGATLPVLNSGYAEFSASALWNDGTFLSTDRIVLKFYGSRIVTGSDPSYQFQFGGLSPVRSLVPIPLNVVPALPATVNAATNLFNYYNNI